MANPARSIRIEISPVSPGATQETNAITRVTGAASLPIDSVPTRTVVRVLDAQMVGLKNYIALIKNGDVTTTVETAINALL